MSDNLSAVLAEEMSEICALMREFISRQEKIETGVSKLAREVWRLCGNLPTKNTVTVDIDTYNI